MKRVPFREAVGRKFPESVVFVVTSDGEERNVMPAGWSTFTSGDPLMLAVSIGLDRHTHALLERTEEFVVAFPSAAQKAAIEFCGSHTGAEVDKFAESGLRPLPADEVSVPIIEDAAACFECEKRGAFRTGDHRLFAGEVVAAHVSDRYAERVKNLGRDWGNGPERFKTLSELLAGPEPNGTDS